MNPIKIENSAIRVSGVRLLLEHTSIGSVDRWLERLSWKTKNYDTLFFNTGRLLWYGLGEDTLFRR